MYKITVAKRDELYEISVFLNACWRATYNEIISPEYLDALSDDDKYEKLLKRFDENPSDFLIMRYANELIGVAIFGKSYTEGYLDDGEISAIYIHQDYIGQGYGHALFTEAERMLSEKGYTNFIVDVLSDNTNAIVFYQKHGYEIVAERSIDLGGIDYPLTVLRKGYTTR